MILKNQASTALHQSGCFSRISVTWPIAALLKPWRRLVFQKVDPLGGLVGKGWFLVILVGLLSDF